MRGGAMGSDQAEAARRRKGVTLAKGLSSRRRSWRLGLGDRGGAWRGSPSPGSAPRPARQGGPGASRSRSASPRPRAARASRRLPARQRGSGQPSAPRRRPCRSPGRASPTSSTESCARAARARRSQAASTPRPPRTGGLPRSSTTRGKPPSINISVAARASLSRAGRAQRRRSRSTPAPRAAPGSSPSPRSTRAAASPTLVAPPRTARRVENRPLVREPTNSTSWPRGNPPSSRRSMARTAVGKAPSPAASRSSRLSSRALRTRERSVSGREDRRRDRAVGSSSRLRVSGSAIVISRRSRI